jgi:hypothetical protein
MSDPQETFRTLLERYRNGRCEAPYTVSLLEGLHIEMDADGKKRLLNCLWDELLCDFQKAVRGESVLNWIFPVAIPFWVKLGDTTFMTKGLLGLLDLRQPGVGKAWVTHVCGELCHALRHDSGRFAEDSMASIQAWVGELKFAANSEIGDFEFDPEMNRALNRIDDSINEMRFKPIEINLLAARNAEQAKTAEDPSISNRDAAFTRQGPRHAVAILPHTLPFPKLRIRDVVIHTNSGIFGNEQSLEKFPPVSKERRLSDQILLGPIDAVFAKTIMDGCETTGHGMIPAVRQFAQLYSFVRDLPESSEMHEWDSDNQLTTCIALSRLVHPTSTGLAYAARIAYGPKGLERVHPAHIRGIGVEAFLSPNRTRDWLTEREAEALCKLLAPYPPNLPQRVTNALWYHEYAARTYYLDHRWTLVCTALESLVHTDRGGSTKQFKRRVSKLASELGVSLSENEADSAYDQRSGLAHGTSFLSSPGRQGPTPAQIDLYDRLEDTLRLAILRAIQDKSFADIFRDDDQIRGKWVV